MKELAIVQSPKGSERLKWFGPAFIWMLSAAGSGELLFTRRIVTALLKLKTMKAINTYEKEKMVYTCPLHPMEY